MWTPYKSAFPSKLTPPPLFYAMIDYVYPPALGQQTVGTEGALHNNPFNCVRSLSVPYIPEQHVDLEGRGGRQIVSTHRRDFLSCQFSEQVQARNVIVPGRQMM